MVDTFLIVFAVWNWLPTRLNLKVKWFYVGEAKLFCVYSLANGGSGAVFQHSRLLEVLMRKHVAICVIGR